MLRDANILEEGVLLGITGNWDRRLSRRAFIGLGGMSAAALVLGSGGVCRRLERIGGLRGAGPGSGRAARPAAGFQYRVISEEGTQALQRRAGARRLRRHGGLPGTEAATPPSWCATTSSGSETPTAGLDRHEPLRPGRPRRHDRHRRGQRRPHGGRGLRHLLGHPEQLRGRGDAVGHLAHLRGGPHDRATATSSRSTPRTPRTSSPRPRSGTWASSRTRRWT